VGWKHCPASPSVLPMPLQKQARQVYDENALIRFLAKPLVAVRRKWLMRNDACTKRVFARFAASLAEDPVVHVEGFPGEYVLGPKSDMFRHIVMSGAYEQDWSHLCRTLVASHRDAIDIGANIGLYTVLLSTLVPTRRVLAIEPTPEAASRLRKNLKRNDAFRNTVVFEGVATEVSGYASLSVVPGKEEYSSLGAVQHQAVAGERRETIKVASSTIDDLVEAHNLDPGFVKIDVEGMEHSVIGGMHKVLAKYRPVILTEISDPLLRANGSSSEALIKAIRSYSYCVRDIAGTEVQGGCGLVGELVCAPE
jgi:FkbM family methyltransferase